LVGPEHKLLGDITSTTLDLGNGVELTWGDIVAIAGDEYSSLDELLTDTHSAEGKQRLLAALESAEVPGTLAAKLAPGQSTQQHEHYKDEHKTRFFDLALRNVTHFPDQGAALGEWGGYHQTAIQKAVEEGLSPVRTGDLTMAYANEAYGQHFLTDCFSGGHIRVPRTQMIDYYTTDFGPKVAGALVLNFRDMMIELCVGQANSQTLAPEFLVRRRVAPRVTATIDAAIAKLGGMTKLGEVIGLGIAGAISGAMHDDEGKRGVWVASEDHPEPWLAKGDDRMKESPVSEAQAKLAILEAKAQVDEAYNIGVDEAGTRDLVPADPPARLHFALNSAKLTSDSARDVEAAAAYMTYEASTVVEVVGHTDPTGSDDYNDGLGLRRAVAVTSKLVDQGVDAARCHPSTKGEKSLLTRDPRRYGENRRVDLGWGVAAVGPGGMSMPVEDRARERAMKRAQEMANSERVLRYVPRPAEETGSVSLNPDVPEWHWGNLSDAFRTLIDDYVRGRAGPELAAALGKAHELDEIVEDGITISPRVHVKAILDLILESPTRQLGNYMAESP
jgi:outer membrane protein OmpA-like peptidoglycan-associated protein